MSNVISLSSKCVDTRRLKSLIDEDTVKFQFIMVISLAGTKAASFWSKNLSAIHVANEIEITPQQFPLAFNKNYVHKFDAADVMIAFL